MEAAGRSSCGHSSPVDHLRAPPLPRSPQSNSPPSNGSICLTGDPESEPEAPIEGAVPGVLMQKSSGAMPREPADAEPRGPPPEGTAAECSPFVLGPSPGADEARTPVAEARGARCPNVTNSLMPM